MRTLYGHAQGIWSRRSNTSTSSVSFTVPGSDVFPLDLFHLRHGLIGGTLARCWVSWTQSSGGLRVIDFTHNGSSADPRTFVGSLSAANRTVVSLGSTIRTATQVAQAIVDALVADGLSASRIDATVTVLNASNLVIPSSVDTTDASLRGMWGNQRFNWGTGADGQTLNQNGGTDGTGSVHIAPLGTAGRILGVYLFTRTDLSGMDVLLACSTGPVHSTSPGAMTPLGQGALVAAQGLAITTFAAVAVTGTADLWAHYRGNNGGGITFRAHGATPVGRGQLGLNEELIWDTTSSASSGTQFGATYTPTVDNTFNIYVAIGVIFEIPDADGNYFANGAMRVRIGDHNNDDEHGTQFPAGPALLDGETTHHRFQWPNWTAIQLSEVHRTVDALGADEDSRVAIYQWSDLNFPSTTPAELVADLGPMGMTTQNAANTFVVSPAVSVGTEVVGSNAILSLGFNYTRQGGSTITSYTLPVFLTTPGDSYWGNAWTDDRETWHDDIPGASDRGYAAGVSEYRTRVSVGNTGMPTDDPDTAWPDPFVTDASDDSPAAIAADWIIIQRTGIVASA